jgi:hypothetical protein
MCRWPSEQGRGFVSRITLDWAEYSAFVANRKPCALGNQFSLGQPTSTTVYCCDHATEVSIPVASMKIPIVLLLSLEQSICGIPQKTRLHQDGRWD